MSREETTTSIRIAGLLRRAAEQEAAQAGRSYSDTPPKRIVRYRVVVINGERFLKPVEEPAFEDTWIPRYGAE